MSAEKFTKLILTVWQDWIAEGALQPQDKVRRGALTWREAGTVRLLQGFFNDREAVNDSSVLKTSGAAAESENNFQPETENLSGSPQILQHDLPGQISKPKTGNLQNTGKIFDNPKPIREVNNSVAETLVWPILRNFSFIHLSSKQV